MKVYVKYVLIYFVIMSNVGAVIADEWTEKASVESMQTDRADIATPVVIPGTCVNDNKVFLDANEANHNEVVSLLLAAVMSDKKVKLYCSSICASNTRCRVLDVEIYK